MGVGYNKELQIIKEAILNEIEGYSFYQLAAEKSSEPDIKNIFLYLAEEEKKHEQYLKGLYKTVEQGKPEAVEVFPYAATASPNIFNPEKLKKEPGSLIVSALSIGVMMEKSSIDFYKDAAEKTSLEKAKRFYIQLADWENTHLETLSRAYDFAKEEWWAEQGFSPA